MPGGPFLPSGLVYECTVVHPGVWGDLAEMVGIWSANIQFRGMIWFPVLLEEICAPV